jgi:hypothetical protein
LKLEKQGAMHFVKATETIERSISGGREFGNRRFHLIISGISRWF